jgi:hypothetical protein
MSSWCSGEASVPDNLLPEQSGQDQDRGPPACQAGAQVRLQSLTIFSLNSQGRIRTEVPSMSSWCSGEARVPDHPLPEQSGQDQDRGSPACQAGTQVRLQSLPIIFYLPVFLNFTIFEISLIFGRIWIRFRSTAY